MLLRLKTSHLSKLLVLFVLTGCLNTEETVVERKSEENKVQQKLIADQSPIIKAPAVANVSLEEEEEAVEVEEKKSLKPSKSLKSRNLLKKLQRSLL